MKRGINKELIGRNWSTYNELANDTETINDLTAKLFSESSIIS